MNTKEELIKNAEEKLKAAENACREIVENADIYDGFMPIIDAVDARNAARKELEYYKKL